MRQQRELSRCPNAYFERLRVYIDHIGTCINSEKGKSVERLLDLQYNLAYERKKRDLLN